MRNKMSIFSLGGTKRVIVEDGYIIFEKSPGIEIQFEYAGEDSTHYIYMPPVVKHTCMGCVYSYSIEETEIRISKKDLYLQYKTPKRISVYKMK